MEEESLILNKNFVLMKRGETAHEALCVYRGWRTQRRFRFSFISPEKPANGR